MSAALPNGRSRAASSASKLGKGETATMNTTTLNLKSATTPESQQDDDPSAPLRTATSLPEVLAALNTLHTRESALTHQLDTLLSSHSSLTRSLGRLDNLRATLGSQAIAARTISSSMLSAASETASDLSGRVRRLDLEKQRVQDTLAVVEQVAELKACVAGVVGSMGAPQDWEAAAGYVARAAKVPEHIVKGGFAAAVVPTVEVPDPPWVTLEEARESLCMLFLREFEKAVDENDGARVTRFFKLFPLIGRGDVGLDVYGRYVCQGVASQARAVLREGSNAVGQQQSKKDGFFYANALTKLFEHVARIVDGHGGLVERHYGRKMVKVVERLQMEADVQGGIILDSWSDDRGVDRTLTDIKSYPFSFLVQSFLPQQRGLAGTSRVNSPALGAQTNDARNSEDEGVNMKEVDGLLSEIAVMLGKWSLYSRFLAGKCKDPETPEDAPLSVPEVLTKSNLHNKVSGKLISPYNTMTTFFFRRSVEKAFQLDESPSGLSLSMSKPIGSNPPFIMSAVDDVMYIVNAVIKRSLSTAQRDIVASVIPAIGRVLGSDFVVMIQRKMRDESYPKPAVQGGFPPEDKIISFIVLINSLDMANEYLARIVSTYLGPSTTSHHHQQQNGHHSSHGFSPRDSFPFDHDAAFVTQLLQTLNTSFTAKTTELLNSGLQVLYNQVIKPRLRPVLSDTFRDADYTLTEEDISDLLAQAAGGGGDASDHEHLGPLLDNIIPDRDNDDDDTSNSPSQLSRVASRFEHGWDALMKPIARLMTPRTYSSVLDITASYLARVLEKRAWSYGTSSSSNNNSNSQNAGGGGGVSPYGAIRMERDFLGIVSVVSKGGNYAVREPFAKMTQILTVANMEEEEWEEINNDARAIGDEEDGGMEWVLSEEERRRARNLVRS